MEISAIASLASALAQNKVMEEASMSVMKRSLDTIKENGENITQLLSSSVMSDSHIDMTI